MFKKIIREVFANNINYLYLFLFNLGIVFFQFFYIRAMLGQVTEMVPFWYSRAWGLDQLAPKEYLYSIPALLLFLLTMTVGLSYFCKKYFLRYGNFVVFSVCTACSLFFTYCVLNLISISSQAGISFLSHDYAVYINPFVTAFVLTLIFTPLFIKYAHDRGVVTQPGLHSHPGMVLLKPSARGGGFVYTVVFLFCAMFFVPPTLSLIGIYISMALISVLGLLDDFQNTHPSSKSRVLENPFIRLSLLLIIVSIVVTFGLQFNFVSSVHGGVFNFSELNINLADIISKIATILWIVWILNLLSWSNGIDGQYGGVVGVISVAILVLALRYTPITEEFRSVALLGAISAGASFGILPFSWSPSKIMWGFGAMSVGLALAGLSIVINAKIAVSILIMLIPFLDAVVTVFRRMLQQKNPLRGDRGHLHHILLDRGWSPQRIAVFYWLATAIFAYVAITTADKDLVRTTLILVGIVASFIVLMNIIQLKKSNGKA